MFDRYITMPIKINVNEAAMKFSQSLESAFAAAKKVPTNIHPLIIGEYTIVTVPKKKPRTVIAVHICEL